MSIKKIFATILIISLSTPAFADSKAWNDAYQQYQNNNLSELYNLTLSNPNDDLIGYLYADASLNKSSQANAVEFIRQHKNNYFTLNLSHKLLNYYFNNQNWSQYINIYQQLPATQASVSETCSYDLANYALSNQGRLKSNINDLVRNKMPSWCISLVATRLANNQNKGAKLPFLYGLLVNNQLSQYNQVAQQLSIPQVTSTQAKNTNQYQTVYNMAILAQKSPDIAMANLKSLNLDNSTQQYLANLIAASLAKKQMFSLAKQAIQAGNNNFLSDDEHEWRVRTYLALADWDKVIYTISKMPDGLQNKDVWRYWKAFALSKNQQPRKAQRELLQITPAYNFYSLLAQAELGTALNVNTQVQANALKNIANYTDTQLGFNLYQSGKKNNNSLFVKLGTQLIYYIISISNDNDIAAISDEANRLGMNDIAIYAATKMKTPDASRSFPAPFLDLYKKYAQQYGIDYTYSLAITRQESRFNRNALAFDGGVGLMQIMPATANYIAKKISSNNCYKNYECNIQFGTWFLSHLADKFDGNLIYASAGYNAGPGRAHRWEQNFGNLDNRIQIELIPFKITRDYVQHISTNKLVYDAMLNNKPLDLYKYLEQSNNRKTDYITDDEDSESAISAPTIDNSDNDD